MQTSTRIYNLRAPSAGSKAVWLSLLSVFHGKAMLGSQVPLEVPFALKAVLIACSRHLRTYGTRTNGIFRLPANGQLVELLYRNLMEQGMLEAPLIVPC